MLLIWGKKDKFVPPALAHEFARYNENLQLLSIEDVGHCPHDENPEIINQAILDWINSLSDRQSKDNSLLDTSSAQNF
jgi:pimeloyl-ACP methyl ester carboxylesterase